MQVDNPTPMKGEKINLIVQFGYDNMEEYDIEEPDYANFTIALVDENETQESNKLISNKLNSILNQKGLEKMEVKNGDTFDAEIHEAITQIPAPSKKMVGKIIDVTENGYQLGDKIIRYPKVVVGN